MFTNTKTMKIKSQTQRTKQSQKTKTRSIAKTNRKGQKKSKTQKLKLRNPETLNSELRTLRNTHKHPSDINILTPSQTPLHPQTSASSEHPNSLISLSVHSHAVSLSVSLSHSPPKKGRRGEGEKGKEREVVGSHLISSCFSSAENVNTKQGGRTFRLVHTCLIKKCVEHLLKKIHFLTESKVHFLGGGKCPAGVVRVIFFWISIPIPKKKLVMKSPKHFLFMLKCRPITRKKRSGLFHAQLFFRDRDRDRKKERP